MKLPAEQYQFLEDSYLRNFPIEIPEEWLRDYRSIVTYKDLIKRTVPNEKVLNRLIEVVIERIRTHQRFQRLLLIKLIKQNIQKEYLDKETTDNLFFLFSSLIVGAQNEIAWKLTTLIKDLELDEAQVKWLIENYKSSEHIVNRLLRYPKVDRQISAWGKDCMKKHELEGRISELIGLQLNTNVSFKYKDKVAYVWGVHYSKLDEGTKKDLLLKATSLRTIVEIIRICERNQFLEIIEFYYDKFT